MLKDALAPFVPEGRQPALPASDRLDAAIEAAATALDAKLLIILDQFDEYFLYRTGEDAERRFVDEPARCVNRAEAEERAGRDRRRARPLRRDDDRRARSLGGGDRGCDLCRA
jgi:hypothetical protein